MVTPKKIIIKDLELADKEIARLRKENKKLMKNGILTQKERDKNGMDSMALQIENKKLKAENKKLKEEKEISEKLNLGEKTEYLRCIEELKKENEELRKLTLANKIQENHIFFGNHS